MNVLNLTACYGRVAVAGWSFCLWAAIAPGTVAQIVPDGTLPQNFRDREASPKENRHRTLTIEGGTTAGSNLFHSFQEFSIPEHTSVRFDNAAAIQNIITRVTGDRAAGSEFVISGRENLPPTPAELTNNQASTWLDWRLGQVKVGWTETAAPLTAATVGTSETIVALPLAGLPVRDNHQQRSRFSHSQKKLFAMVRKTSTIAKRRGYR